MTENETKTVLATEAMLAAVIFAGEAKGKRMKADYTADRLRVAATEPSLLKAMQKMSSLMDTEEGAIFGETYCEFVRVASGEDSARMLRWMRENAPLAVMIATQPHETRDELSSLIELPEANGTNQVVLHPERSFTVPLSVHMLAPLAHGDDTKAGNATLFRRQQVLMADGSVRDMPIYAGNALRGQVRDALADHLFTTLGLKAPGKAPSISLPCFYLFYSGGALEETGKDNKAEKELGRFGGVRTDGIRNFRNAFPGLSLLGCAIGSRIIPGRVRFADLRPRCREWGTGDIPEAELYDWQFLTRREDLEDHDKNNSMIAQTEVLKAGTWLDGGIDLSSHANELEASALATGLELIAANGYIGAESRRGFGKCEIKIGANGVETSEKYRNYLEENKDRLLAYMKELEFLGDLTASTVPDSSKDDKKFPSPKKCKKGDVQEDNAESSEYAQLDMF